MKSAVSEAVRSKRLEADSLLSPLARLERALQIGESELALFMSANKLSRAEALRQLEANKQKGRRPACKFPKHR